MFWYFLIVAVVGVIVGILLQTSMMYSMIRRGKVPKALRDAITVRPEYARKLKRGSK